VAVFPVSPASSQPAQGAAAAPVVSAAVAPRGAEKHAVEWVSVVLPQGGAVLAAVARPPGAGPFPAVVILHGTHGFAREYVRLAEDLARGGLLAVAACWFGGRAGGGIRSVTPVDCPVDSPPMPNPASAEANQIVTALVTAVRARPDARPERVGLVGHSRGGSATLSYLVRVGDVQAAVLEAAGYPNQPALPAARVSAPILILHGTVDGPTGGGAPGTAVQLARDFEAALRAAGKPVEAVYYDGGRHNDIFDVSRQYRDEVKRMLEFFLRHLGG
jgi:dienelactone hydrolase